MAPTSNENPATSKLVSSMVDGVRRVRSRIRNKDSPPTEHQEAQNKEQSTQSEREAGTFSSDTERHGFAPIHLAAIRGNVAEMRRILQEKGLNIDLGDKNDDRTALQWAARLGHVEIIESLWDKRPNIKRRDKDGKTALHWAAIEGRDAVVSELLKRDDDGSSVVVADKDKLTALHYAAMKGQVGVVDQLITKTKKPAFVDAKDNSGRTALAWAAMEGHREVVDKMVGAGASNSIVDSEFGRTPLHWACCKGHRDVARFLLEQVTAKSLKQDQDNRTALHLAADHGDADVVQVILDHVGDWELNVPDRYGCKPVHYAAEGGHKVAIDILPKQDSLVDVDAKDDYGWTALRRAAARGHYELVELLLNRGASVRAPDKKNETPVHAAAKNGQAKVVRLLLEKESKAIEDEDKGGSRPLQAAAAREIQRKKKVDGSPEETALEALLALGADAAAKDSQGRTALHWAAQEGNPMKLGILLQHMKKLPPAGGEKEESIQKSEAMYWAVTGFADALRKDKFVAEEDGLATLYWEPEKRYQKVLYLLLEAQAYQDGKELSQFVREISSSKVKDVVGQIAVRFAISTGNKDLLKPLVETGVDLGLKDFRAGETVLHLAARTRMRDHKERRGIVKVLLEHNAPVYLKNAGGRTVLHIAAIERYNEVVEEISAWLHKDQGTREAASESTNNRATVDWAGEFVKTKDSEGKTAAELGDAETVKILLRHVNPQAGRP